MEFAILNAFVEQPLSGNPAAVCFLTEWLTDDTLCKIARQFGYSETAFVIKATKAGHKTQLRWFTPTTEVDLCGHATMAAAHAILGMCAEQATMSFHTHSGKLVVHKYGEQITMDFPARQLSKFHDLETLEQRLQVKVKNAVIAGPTILAVVEDEATVANIQPDLDQIAQLPFNAVIPTAIGNAVDFVSRFFGPRIGIPEDPVTGAAHTGLASF